MTKYRFVYRGDELGLQFKRYGLWHNLLPYSAESIPSIFCTPFTCRGKTKEWLLNRLKQTLAKKLIYGEVGEI